MDLINKNQLETLLSEIYNRKPVSYSKIRVSGSKRTAYFMHSKSACMPGQKEKFTSNINSKLEQELTCLENHFTRVFIREKYLLSKKPIGKKYTYNYHQKFTYDEYLPYDDIALERAIRASYRQVFGNLHPMESQRLIDIERRLRNGDIPIREFVRSLGKSTFYLANYFDRVSQKKCIQLSFKHLLGRPLFDNNELISSIELMNSEGFEAHIDSLVDSLEYEEFFGENIVPYQRFWDSPIGAKTSSFINTASYEKGFASSDNVIYGIKRN